MDASQTMHGGFPPEEPLSTMEQMLLLGTALFCALVWRCLARSMDRRAREREKRRNNIPSNGSFSLRTRSTNDSFQQPPSTSVFQRCASVQEGGSYSGARLHSDTKGAAGDVPLNRRVSEDSRRWRKLQTGSTPWKSANNLGGSVALAARRNSLSARRASMQLMFDRLDTLERRRGGGSPLEAAMGAHRSIAEVQQGGCSPAGFQQPQSTSVLQRCSSVQEGGSYSGARRQLPSFKLE